MNAPDKDRATDDTPADVAADTTSRGKTAARKPRKTTTRKRAATKKGASTDKTRRTTAAAGNGDSDASTGDPAAQTRPAATTAASAPAPTTTEATVLLSTPMTVRWRDLDAFNHVNNSKYLSYLEEARLRWMLSVPGQGLDDDVAPVVAAAHLNYRRPIEWPAEIVIELFVERLGNTSLSVGHRITAAGNRDTLYCDGYVVMVWIDRATGQAAALPESVREACRR